MKKSRIIALLLASVMLLSACGKAPDTKPTAEGEKEPKPAETEKAYTGPKDYIGWTTTMATFNPHMYTNSKEFMNLGTFVAKLSTVDGTDKLVFEPHHAEELPKSSDGGKTWTVKIRKDLKWNDGTVLNAKTYEYSMKMLLDPKLANKNANYLFDPCVVANAKEYYQGKADWKDVGIKATDDNTLEIKLSFPASDLDFNTTIGSLIWPVEESIYEKCMNADRTSTTYGTTLETTPSCGMFTLTEWVTDGNDKFVTNKDDPMVKKGYIRIDSFTRRYVKENTTRFQMFMSGELDQCALMGDNYEKYKNDPRAYPIPSPNVWGFFMNGNSKNPIMQQKDFRNALHYGAAREEICRDVTKLYPASSGLVSTGIFVGDPLKGGEYYRDTDSAKKILEKYTSNDDKAKELFDKAYKANGGKPVSVEYIYFEGQESQKRQGEILQETYENLFGKERFTLTLRSMPPSAAYDVYRAGDYDLGLGVRLTNVFNPWSSMNVWTSDYADKYITGFGNEEFDKLQKACVYGDLTTDTKGRADALAKMEEMLLDYGAFCPIMQNDNVNLYADRIDLATQTSLPMINYSISQCDINAAK